MGIFSKTLKNASIYALCEILGKGSSFFLIPLYTSYFSTSDFGVLEVLQLTASVVVTLLTMGIHSSISKFFFDRSQEEKRNEVISVTLIAMACAGIFLSSAVFFSSQYLSSFILNSPLYSEHFFIIFLDMSLGLVVQIPMTYLMIKQKAVLYSIVSLSRLVLQLTIKIVLISVFHMGIRGALYGSLIATLVSSIFLLGYILRIVRLTFSFDLLQKMVVYSFPLLGSWVGQFSMNFGDRFFLTKLSDLSSVGIYSLAYKFGLLNQMLITGPLMMTWGPKSFEMAADEGSPQIFSRMFTYFVLVQVFFSLGLSIMIRPMLILMAQPSYHSAYLYVPLISASYIFQGIFMYLQFGPMREKKTSIIGFSVLLAAAINILLNLVLIHYLQIWGAAISTILSYGILPAILLKPAQRCYRIPFEKIKLLKITTAALVFYFSALFVEFSSFWLTAGLKLLLVLLFPVVLYLWGVFGLDEIATLKNTLRRNK